MPIPKSRAELLQMVTTSFEKLLDELSEAGGARIAGLPCVDDWTVKDVLVVRSWWTESVNSWIRAGREGGTPVVPADGYTWQETPRLNADLVERARSETYDEVLARLRSGYERTLVTIAELDDAELMEPGIFEWAGKWPLSRWISINTARQYTTARQFVRAAVRRERSSPS